MAAFTGSLTLLGPLLLQAAGWGAAALEAGPSRDASVAAGLMDLGNMGFLLRSLPPGAQGFGSSVRADWLGAIVLFSFVIPAKARGRCRDGAPRGWTLTSPSNLKSHHHPTGHSRPPRAGQMWARRGIGTP